MPTFADINNTRELYEAAIRKLTQGETEEALLLAQEMIAADQEDARGWCVEAEARLALGESEAADFAVQQATQLDPHAPAVLLLRARIELAAESYDAAEECAALAFEQADASEQQRNALLLRAEAIFHACHEELNAFFEDQDDEDDFVMGESFVLPEEVLERLEDGLTLAREALAMDGSSVEAWSLQARYYSMLDRDDEALDAWEQAHLLDPDELDVLHALAQAQEELEMPEAYHSYLRLHQAELEQLNPLDHVSLLFPHEDFVRMMFEIWASLEENLDEIDMPISFSIQADTYPGTEAFDDADEGTPFDPRVGLFVDFPATYGEDVSVNVTLYQFNIERDLETGEEGELYAAIEDLMNEFLADLFDHMDRADEDEW